MKTAKKALSILLALVMVAALSVSAFAAAKPAVAPTGTIKIDNATNGVKYEAYKILDVTVDGSHVSYYTTNADLFKDGPFKVSAQQADGTYIVEQNGTDAEEVINWVKANLDKFAKSGEATASGSVAEIKDLGVGFYYVKSGLGTVVSIDTLSGTDKTVKDKNDQTPGNPDKNITGESGDNQASNVQGGKANDAAVGSTENFEVKFNATNFEVKSGVSTPITVYNISDKPEGLEIKADTVKVYINDTAVAATAYTAEVKDGKLEVTIPWVDDSNNPLYNAVAPATTIPVKVTYDAVVLASAATQVAKNKVEVSFNNNPAYGNSSTETTTYQFNLSKLDTDKAGLAGAKFQLHIGGADGKLVGFTVNGNTYTVGGSETTITMAAASVLINGLDKGAYTLVEVQAPAGYTLADPKSVSADDLSPAGTAADSVSVVEVVDNPGTPLPGTGGIGTTMFYILGSILVIAAGVVLVTRRRMNAE